MLFRSEYDHRFDTALEQGSLDELLHEIDVQNMADLAKCKDNVNRMRAGALGNQEQIWRAQNLY